MGMVTLLPKRPRRPMAESEEDEHADRGLAHIDAERHLSDRREAQEARLPSRAQEEEGERRHVEDGHGIVPGVKETHTRDHAPARKVRQRAGRRLWLTTAAHSTAHREENAADQREKQGERPRPAPDSAEKRPVGLEVLEHPASPGPDAEKKEPERLEPSSDESELKLPLRPEARRRVKLDDRGHVSPRNRPPVLFRLCVHPTLERVELGRGCGPLDHPFGDPRHTHEKQQREDE
jgi:hypothetical protein